MSLGINKVILLGEVSDTPACKTTNSGLSVANINLATVESWVDKKTGDTRKRTEWHRVVFFNHHAKIIATSVQQGAQLYVCGSNQTSKWEKDGITRYTTKIIGSELQILGIKTQESAKLNEAPLPGHKETSDWNSDNSKDDWDFDDVPF